MALLAESLVDEWLNRQGFFTIREIKHGVGEIDLLGVRPNGAGLEGWHVEVQASFRPIGNISPLAQESPQGFAKSRTSMKHRSRDLLEGAVTVWIAKKYTSPSESAARGRAWPGLEWKKVMVHAVVREPIELELIQSHNVELVPLHRVLKELGHSAATGIKGGAGTDLFELIEYFYKNATVIPGTDT